MSEHLSHAFSEGDVSASIAGDMTPALFSPTMPGTLQAAQRQQVNGEINVRFSNPPPGTTVQTQSLQSGVKLSSDVGRRSLAGSGY